MFYGTNKTENCELHFPKDVYMEKSELLTVAPW